jgi:hypothetical protein
VRACFTFLPVPPEHTYEVYSLRLHHLSPLDRLLIAQARVNGLSVVTADRAFTRYEVRTILIEGYNCWVSCCSSSCRAYAFGLRLADRSHLDSAAGFLKAATAAFARGSPDSLECSGRLARGALLLGAMVEILAA